MGCWGVGILQDDTAWDVYESYFDMHNEGIDQSIIRSDLEKRYADAIADEEDSTIFWLALAEAEWETGKVQPDVFQQVAEIVKTGAGLQRWEEADEILRKQRQRVLQNLLRRIGSPNKKPRKIKSTKQLPAVFEAGDCLSILLSDGSYGAALVLTVDNSSAREGTTLVGILKYKFTDKPSVEIFRQREWLILTHHDWHGRPAIIWCLAHTYLTAATSIEKVDHIEVNSNDPKQSVILAGWNIGPEIELQYQWESE